jgi:hypothetical protein
MTNYRTDESAQRTVGDAHFGPTPDHSVEDSFMDDLDGIECRRTRMVQRLNGRRAAGFSHSFVNAYLNTPQPSS